MSGPLSKVESGKAKQKIAPRTWTWVKYDKGAWSFKVPTAGVWEWTTFLRVEYPKVGFPTILRGRFGRFPGTDKLDETGHDDKTVRDFAGGSYHSHWTHTIDQDTKMPLGFWVWHNGKSPIVLDGRQIKAKKVG